VNIGAHSRVETRGEFECSSRIGSVTSLLSGAGGILAFLVLELAVGIRLTSEISVDESLLASGAVSALVNG